MGGILAAGVIVLILLFLTGPIADLPKAVLGATIIAAAIGLIDRAAWRELWRADRVEVAIAGVTTAGVLISGVLEAITLAVGLSIVDVVRRSARPHDAALGWVERLGRYADVAVHRDARVTPGVVVYRLDDRLFFANASYVKGRVREAIRGAPGATHSLVFDAEAVSHVDAAGLAALRDIARRLEGQGVTLVFARVKEPIRRRLETTGLIGELGAERFHPTVRAAVEACAERGRTTEA
jgi:anti-anti-sigma factor